MNKKKETSAGASSGPARPPTGDKIGPKVILLMISLLGILIIRNAGHNKSWFAKVGEYWDAFIEQKDAGLTLEQIKDERWSKPYIVSKAIKTFFQNKNIKNPVILLEPNDYVREVKGLPMPEPIVIYFYTGMQALWMDSKRVNEATHILYQYQGKVRIEPIKSREELQSILVKYKKYKVTS